MQSVVIDGLMRYRLRYAAIRMLARVEVAVQERKIAAGHVQTDTMAAAEYVAGRLKVDRVLKKLRPAR